MSAGTATLLGARAKNVTVNETFQIILPVELRADQDRKYANAHARAQQHAKRANCPQELVHLRCSLCSCPNPSNRRNYVKCLILIVDSEYPN